MARHLRVGGFNQAPALEPKLGACLLGDADSGFLAASRASIRRLREYNDSGLQHFGPFTRRCPDTMSRRNTPTMCSLDRGACCAAIFGNWPYVEGWAVYTQAAPWPSKATLSDTPLPLDAGEAKGARARPIRFSTCACKPWI